MKIYTYDEAYQESLKYFDGDELAANVFISKYAMRNKNNEIIESSPLHLHKRIAKEVSRIEKNKFKNPLTEDEIFGLIDKFKYIVFQGSPMFGIGNQFQTVSLSNCYVLESPLDSYSSILQIDEQLVNISKRRGGVGIDIDNLRPANSPVNNAARTSSGIETWMERYSNSIREVGQGGRRGALMLTCSVHHPDIETFITIKNDSSKVTGANISIKLTKEFIEAVENDSDYELRWPINSKNPKISKKIKARDIWGKIIHSAWLRAEPGLLMWENVIKFTPTSCYEDYKSISTNPCGEIPLSPLDSCRLLCLNLYGYVVKPFEKDSYFDYNLFYSHAKLAQRLMDDLIDLESEKIDEILQKLENDPEPDNIKNNEREMWLKIKKFNNEGRRTGTGITALGDTLAALGIKYGSEDSINVTEKIYKTLKFGCYQSSIQMAEELGCFKEFDYEKEKNNEFLNRFKSEFILLNEFHEDGVFYENKQHTFIDGKLLYEKMKKKGRRNIALITTAPTGSVSIMTQTTSGIEPLFIEGYKRRKKINHNDKDVRVDFVDQNGDKWQEFMVYHPKIKEWMNITKETDLDKSPWFKACSADINWINRIKLQAVAQKHVCHAISSTINLPEDVTEEKVSEIYLYGFKSGCKGITIYRDNCRSGVLVNLNKKENKNIIKLNDAPKRPNVLSCDIYHISVKNEKYIVAVGLLNGMPYEIFAGKDNNNVASKYKTGLIKKIKRGNYNLINNNDEILYENLADLCNNEEEALNRMISTSLRHGSEIKFVVEQLSKTKGELQSFAKSISRALKHYIKDGEQVTGQDCPECSSKLFRESGCIICKNCSYTICQ
jgi:ribonucleoside-diphosphate reductase alpha chain